MAPRPQHVQPRQVARPEQLAALTHRTCGGAVHVISPSEAVRRGLALMLETGPWRSALVPVAEDSRRVVIWDVDLLAGTGVGEGRSRLRSLTRRARTSVLALAHPARTDLRDVALEAGAHAAVAYDVGAAALYEAVREASRPPRVAAAPAPQPRLDPRWDLSPRETQVLSLIAQGLSNQEIADSCFLSVNSIKTHIRSAYRKTGVTSRSLAVGWCLRHGLTDTSVDEVVRPAP